MKSKKILISIASVLVLFLSSVIYLEVAYGYESNEYASDDTEIDYSDFESNFDENLDPNEYGLSEEITGSVYLTQEFLDGDILKISVFARDMAMPVLGLAFHLKYETNKLQFLKYEPGEFLERGGDPFYLVQNSEEKSEIIFGETLRRNDSFPLGEGLISVFYFQIIERDALDFNFENGVVSTLDTVRQDIDKIVWENLRLDKNGEKITDENAGEGDTGLRPMGNSGLRPVQTNSSNIPTDFTIIIVMSVAIIGLLIWIFLLKKRKQND